MEHHKINNVNQWVTERKGITAERLKLSFFYNREYILAKDKYTATPRDNFTAISIAIRDRLVERWILTQQKYHEQNVKRVYYLSLEFLIGRLLKNNITNLNAMDEAKEAFEKIGINPEDLFEEEEDAGLGNAGLGRLAACFLDSMATLGIPAHGYGIRYDYGIFDQKIINGYQVEFPDNWLSSGNPWEFARPEYTVTVKFYGHTENYTDSNGKSRTRWVNTHDVLAEPYDIPICGYKNDVINTLRLWSAKSVEEFNFGHFNDGDYERAVTNKVFSENITKVLYPNDNFYQGRELRLKQEYLITSASISDIIRRFKSENSDFNTLPDKAVIQLNDTHPALAIVELMRILIDQENLNWDTAWDITVKTFAYTNHTVMPEALEKWPVTLFGKVLPRHLQIIYDINLRFLKEVEKKFPGDLNRIIRMSLIEEDEPDMIRMAYLCIIGSYSINGVSELHTTLLKTHIFRDFYELYPERFNNKTNGVTQRRWLKEANLKLSSLITEAIGDKWTTNLYDIEKILPFKEDHSFREKWQKIKLENKQSLAAYIKKTTGITVNPESLFDIQVKRIHEYKRQLLFCFYIISEYLKIKMFSSDSSVPRTFIFGGKAAPGYEMAKLIIKFINNVAQIINNDKSTNDKIKIVFLENYCVSLAEKIFPASNLSEQISTAGLEASGTGCMKFMLNGALTIATLDGANIEMAEVLGNDNIFIFGLKADEILELRAKKYHPQEFINKSLALKSILELIKNNFFSPSEPGIFEKLYQSINSADNFFVCVDFEPYCKTQSFISNLFLNKDEWTKKSIINVAKSGKFSSDRTIEQYAKEIWRLRLFQKSF